ncbi:hypothetical protein [Amycolatopsis sp. cmx-11-32]|uniref:hypothetical protein n=1 Tax=Amycolatopsis sp. cmx-11-32 TaxID=2785796 RepID=UPI0039E453DB
MTPNPSITAPDTALAVAPAPRVTKYDRVALDAIHVATALPGKWTVGRGRNPDEAADVLCLTTGVRIGFRPRRGPGAWRYDLVPGDVPRDLQDVFVWQHRDAEPSPRSFAVGTPATEVATHIHKHLIPAFHQRLARARIARRERDETHARQHEARRQIADQLESLISPATGDTPRFPRPVRIYCLSDDLMSIDLTMPIDDAIARAPALAQALGIRADETTTTPPAPTESQEKK